ncbi:hypothetical protein V1264_009824 [Littorina saxatilis]|uniref:Ig-like domain-containing protein n=1 Tax=Littorina saxatilis TaxID=31220 RepID=A0AAN9AMY5_9CAEN
MAVNIDGHLIKFHRRDKKRLTFNPTEDDATDNPETGNNFTADMNATDYKNLLRKLMRRSNKDDDDDDAKAISCVDNLARFRMMAKNQPLQFVVIVEEGGEARLTCHFCEDQDKVTESKEWDDAEQQEGRPVWRDADKVRSPILWYRIKHRSGVLGTTFRMGEVKPTLHDDGDSNRIYVTTGHTLVLAKATPDDAGTYFCHDTRTKDRHVKTLLSETEIKEMMSSQGAFRFLIHVDVLKNVSIAAREVQENAPTFARRPKLDALIGNNMWMFTIWASWGQCSMCDQPGEQRRRGTCWIKKFCPACRRIWENWYWDAVLTAQASGIPCRSSLFHEENEKGDRLFRGRFRQDEIMRRTCNTPCKKDLKSGLKGMMPKKTLSSSGLKSMLLIEKKDKTLIIKTINETAGATLSLKCPGAKLDEVVMWVNNSRYMPGVSLDNDTDGRVSVDINGTLHIGPLLLADKGIFHCIVGGKESGHVFINVTEVMVDEFTYYGMWVLGSVGVDFVLFIILMVVKHQRRKRILLSAKDAGLTGSSSDSDDDNNENANININCATTTCSLSAASSDEASSFSCVESRAESRSSSGGLTRYSSRSSCCYGLPSQTSI